MQNSSFLVKAATGSCTTWPIVASPFPAMMCLALLLPAKGLTIHRTNCPNAARLMANYGHRVVKTKWAKNKEISFLTGLKIIGMDDVGVVNKITNLISGEMQDQYQRHDDRSKGRYF